MTKKTSEADKKVKKAIDALSAYEKKYHVNETVVRRMAPAKAKDKSASTTLKKLKEKLPVREGFNVCFVTY